jgi:hypothetical protein
MKMRTELTQIFMEVMLTRTMLRKMTTKMTLQLDSLPPIKELHLMFNLILIPLLFLRTGETLLSTKLKEERNSTK